MEEIDYVVEEKEVEEAIKSFSLMTDEELDLLSSEIEDTSVEHIFTGHCTGEHAYAFLKERLKDRIFQFSSGYRYSFCG